jgi:hypothetical protein
LNSLTKLATAEGNTIVASTVPPCKAEIIGLSPPCTLHGSNGRRYCSAVD